MLSFQPKPRVITFLHVDPSVEHSPFDIASAFMSKLSIPEHSYYILDLHDHLFPTVHDLTAPLTSHSPIQNSDPLPDLPAWTKNKLVEHLANNLPEELLVAITRRLVLDSLALDMNQYFVISMPNLTSIVTFLEHPDLESKIARQGMMGYEIFPSSIATTTSSKNSFFPITLHREVVDVNISIDTLVDVMIEKLS